jgi:hypothetical protein
MNNVTPADVDFARDKATLGDMEKIKIQTSHQRRWQHHKTSPVISQQTNQSLQCQSRSDVPCCLTMDRPHTGSETRTTINLHLRRETEKA